MEEVLQEIENIRNISDDMIVLGKSQGNHTDALQFNC